VILADGITYRMSPPARGAWIETLKVGVCLDGRFFEKKAEAFCPFATRIPISIEVVEMRSKEYGLSVSCSWSVKRKGRESYE